MAISDSFIPEFDHESATTRRVIERAPQAKLDWGPHPKSMTLRGLITHLSNLPIWVHHVLTDDHFDIEPVDGESTRVGPVASVESALTMFDENVAKGHAALEAAEDAVWHEGWTLRSGETVKFTQPRITVMRGSVLNHLIHHRGQLTVYLRMLDVPVPAIYGPSADEGEA